MRLQPKHIAVVGLLAAGVIGALTFRRGAPSGDEGAPAAAAALERRSHAAEPADERGGHLLGHIEPMDAGDGAGSQDRVQPLPPTPDSFEDHGKVVPLAPPREPGYGASPAATADMPADSPWTASRGGHSVAAAPMSQSFQELTTTRPSTRTAWKRHRIGDGDTLSSLAQRYLGDGARWTEIYELNRDQIKDPDVLPIGARLKIPEARAPQASYDALPRGPQASLASDRNEVFTPAPAPPMLPSAPVVPIAPGAYRSAPASARGATYRVQPRDTLVSIARQFYGDEKRYQEIYEANRAQIPDPNNLPAGALLTIP